MFAKWLDTFISEKGIDTEHVLEAEGDSGTNFIPVGVIVEMMRGAPAQEQRGLKEMIVKIDFYNGDVLHYFTHLAQAVAR